MSELIDIDIPYTPVVRALRQIINQLGERRELMASLAGIMHRAVEDNFADGGRPKWQALHPGTIASREKSRPSTWPGQILVRTGQLAASVQAQSDNDQAVVGTNKVYAAIQQFGGQTRPHVIKARNKRALAFGGVVVRQVKHPGSKIPARPFLSLTEQDGHDLVEEAQSFLQDAITKGGPHS
jgi:phage virion morphogenesis protein